MYKMICRRESHCSGSICFRRNFEISRTVSYSFMNSNLMNGKTAWREYKKK